MEKVSLRYMQKVKVCISLPSYLIWYGLRYTFLYSMVPNNSLSWQQSPWLDCVEAESDTGLCYPYMPCKHIFPIPRIKYFSELFLKQVWYFTHIISLEDNSDKY